MRSFRFLLSRRWVLFLLVVALLAYLAWWLGEWQFHRLAERREQNAVVAQNRHTPPAPAADVLEVGEPVRSADEWRKVRATGEYDTARTVVVRYRTRDGVSGVDVVVPLVTREGPKLLVDRGWVQTENAGATDVEAPDPPSGRVTVTGWVRADATGSSTSVTDLSTRAISSRAIAPAVGGDVYGGFVDLVDEDPPARNTPAPNPPPDLGEGPHFFYGLQWWFFGLLALAGFGYLAYDEWRHPGRRVERQQAARDRAETRRAETAAAVERSRPPPD